MKKELPIQQLRKSCFNVNTFSKEVLEWIESENVWNLWVPKEYGGLELSVLEGLNKLKKLARIDGSLGWTITLCSGANFFIGNLQQEVAKEIFVAPKSPVIFGGSGGVFGTAEKKGDRYVLNGTWKYATGAPYLSHFTLNAEIIENGKALKNNDGSPLIRSFVLPKKDVKIIEDWDTMGLMASVTHSFQVENVTCDAKYSFLYSEVYLPNAIFKIPFSLFAELTLWVNYIGMAEHLLEEIFDELSKEIYLPLQELIITANQEINTISSIVEKKIAKNSTFDGEYIQEVHEIAAENVQDLSRVITELYPFLGIKASRNSHPINQIFRDYFTATQHHIFVDRK